MTVIVAGMTDPIDAVRHYGYVDIPVVEHAEALNVCNDVISGLLGFEVQTNTETAEALRAELAELGDTTDPRRQDLRRQIDAAAADAEQAQAVLDGADTDTDGYYQIWDTLEAAIDNVYGADDIDPDADEIAGAEQVSDTRFEFAVNDPAQCPSPGDDPFIAALTPYASEWQMVHLNAAGQQVGHSYLAGGKWEYQDTCFADTEFTAVFTIPADKQRGAVAALAERGPTELGSRWGGQWKWLTLIEALLDVYEIPDGTGQGAIDGNTVTISGVSPMLPQDNNPYIAALAPFITSGRLTWSNSIAAGTQVWDGGRRPVLADVTAAATAAEV